jgi:hypothetical protein
VIPLIVRVPAVEEQVDEVFASDDSGVHVTCCRPGIALCGKRLEGEFCDDSEPTDCIRCEVIDEANTPCGAPFCRVRSAWRLLRSS